MISAPPDTQWLGLGRATRTLGVHPITLRRWADQAEIAVMLTPRGHRPFALATLARAAATAGGDVAGYVVPPRHAGGSRGADAGGGPPAAGGQRAPGAAH